MPKNAVLSCLLTKQLSCTIFSGAMRFIPNKYTRELGRLIITNTSWMWPLEWHPIHLKFVDLNRRGLKTQSHCLSRWDKMGFYAALWVFALLRVSYWSHQQNHAETAADYRDADGVDGLSGRNGDMFSFVVLKRQDPDVFLTIQPFMGLRFAWSLTWYWVINVWQTLWSSVMSLSLYSITYLKSI